MFFQLRFTGSSLIICLHEIHYLIFGTRKDEPGESPVRFARLSALEPAPLDMEVQKGTMVFPETSMLSGRV